MKRTAEGDPPSKRRRATEIEEWAAVTRSRLLGDTSKLPSPMRAIFAKILSKLANMYNDTPSSDLHRLAADIVLHVGFSESAGKESSEKLISHLVPSVDIERIKGDILPLCSDLLRLLIATTDNDSSGLSLLFDEQDTSLLPGGHHGLNLNATPTSSTIYSLISSNLPLLGLADLKRLCTEAESIIDSNPGAHAVNLLMELFDYQQPELVTEILRTIAVNPPVQNRQLMEACPTEVIDLEELSEELSQRFLSEIHFDAVDQRVFQSKGNGYEEIQVQPPVANHKFTAPLVPIKDLPTWAQSVFSGFLALNQIQSQVYPTVFGKFEENVLMCAPTGAGKTNVAMLALLSLVQRHLLPDGTIDRGSFKAVYIAPMKALVNEVVQGFRNRLKVLGLVCNELSGDSSLSKSVFDNTDVIVATPEKWDVVTRKSIDDRVKLIIIDEIHLLNDSRGAVIEAIVARFLRRQTKTGKHIRIVGISATLPNYEDVASFIRASPRGTFFFGSDYRPVPLMQTYVGTDSMKSVKKSELMLTVLLEKILENLGKNQIIVFVHSRNDAVRTALYIRDALMVKDKMSSLLPSDSGSVEVLKEEAKSFKSIFLQDLIPYSIGVHHAGMPREDRNSIEELFADRHLQILVSTLTLAWGVNLPAHTVIVKGTRIYSAEKGEWVNLSGLDMLQMIGRAGRPQYDTEGHGIVITEKEYLSYYLSLNNTQLPVDSRLLPRLSEFLNAEVQAGTINSIADALDWLSYTFFAVRLHSTRGFYGLVKDETASFKTNMIHSAFNELDKQGLLQYNVRSGQVIALPLGRIASFFYMRGSTMATYNRLLRPTQLEADILTVLAASSEFSQIPIREEEKADLERLAEAVPFPVTISIDSGWKISLLAQCVISSDAVAGQVLATDLAYVQANSPRLLRAMLSIALIRGWTSVSRKILNWAKSSEQRVWWVQSPLWQVGHNLPVEVLKRLEKKSFAWSETLQMDPDTLAEVLRISQKSGKIVYKSIHSLPQLTISASVQPISVSLVSLNLVIDKVSVQDKNDYWLFVEDVFQLRALYVEKISVEQRFERLSIVLPITDPVSPHYFVRLASDRFLMPDISCPVSLRRLCLPQKCKRPISLPVDVIPVDVSSFITGMGLGQFSETEILLCSRLLSGEHAILSGPSTAASFKCAVAGGLLSCRKRGGKLILVCSTEQGMQQRLESLYRLLHLSPFTANAGLRIAPPNEICCTTAQRLYSSLRENRWNPDNHVIIFDCLHDIMFSEDTGPFYEVLLCKLLGAHIQLIGLSSWGANITELGQWLRITSKNIYDVTGHFKCPEYVVSNPSEFSPGNQDFARCAVESILSDYSADQLFIIVTTGCEISRLIRDDILSGPLKLDSSEIAVADFVSSDESLTRISEDIRGGNLRILIIQDLVLSSLKISSGRCIIVDPEGRLSVSVLDTAVEITHGSSSQQVSRIVYVTSKRNYWRSQGLLRDSGYIESNLDKSLHTMIAAEVIDGKISNKEQLVEWISGTFLFFRLNRNPNYYGLGDISLENLNSFISSSVEDSVEMLVESEICQCDDGFELKPTPLTASISGLKIDILDFVSLRRGSHSGLRRRGLLQLIFEVPSISSALSEIQSSLPPGCKAMEFLLSQLQRDRRYFRFRCLFRKISTIAETLCDILRVKGFFKSAISCMELCAHFNCLVTPGKSGLLQIPYFEDALISRAQELGVVDVPDIAALGSEQRDDLFRGVSQDKLSSIAEFCNLFPYISMRVSHSSDTGEILVSLQRDLTSASYWLDEVWWLIVAKEDVILGSRKLKLDKMTNVQLSVSKEHLKSCRVVLMSGNYLGADQEEKIGN